MCIRDRNYYDVSDFPGSVNSPNTYANPNLRPKQNTNIEAGMDFGLMKSRINLNFTLYQNYTVDEIFPVTTLWETGYAYRVINGGKIRNRGAEISLDASPFKTKHFSWKVCANWSFNENQIMTLPEEFNGKPFTMSNVGGVVFFNAVVGGSLGDIYGYKLLRNDNGQVVYRSNGLPDRPADVEKVGNAFPKWRAGLQNDFRIKNFTVSFSFDGQYGGVALSLIHI